MKNNERGQTMIIIVSVLFLGGGMGAGLGKSLFSGAYADMSKKHIGQTFDDREQAKKVAEIYAEWQKEVKTIDKKIGVERKKLVKLLSSYTATVEEIKGAFAAVAALDGELQTAFVKRRNELKSQMDETQWQKLFS